MKQLLTSRRLWTFIIAGISSIVTLIIGHLFIDPFAQQLAYTVVSFIVGLAGLLIVMLTVDDVKNNGEVAKSNTAIQVAAINAGSHPQFPPPIALDQSGAVLDAISNRAITADEINAQGRN